MLALYKDIHQIPYKYAHQEGKRKYFVAQLKTNVIVLVVDWMKYEHRNISILSLFLSFNIKVSAYGLDNLGSVPGRDSDFYFYPHVQTGYGIQQFPSQWVSGVL